MQEKLVSDIKRGGQVLELRANQWLWCKIKSCGPKRGCPMGITTQKTAIYTVTTLRTSNFSEKKN
jgi:hypothetical protein